MSKNPMDMGQAFTPYQLGQVLESVTKAEYEAFGYPQTLAKIAGIEKYLFMSFDHSLDFLQNQWSESDFATIYPPKRFKMPKAWNKDLKITVYALAKSVVRNAGSTDDVFRAILKGGSMLLVVDALKELKLGQIKNVEGTYSLQKVL